MIDVVDLVKYLYEQGYIRKYRHEANANIQITCPKIHYKLNKHTGELEEHEETRPSLGITVDEPYIFNCFGCGFRGTIEHLVAEVMDIDLLEATRWLSQRYEFDEDNYRKINEGSKKKLKEYEELWGKAFKLRQYPESYFNPFRQIHRYTLDRGFTKEIAVKYEIGYDKSQRRIIMPIRDLEEKIVGLYGRTIDEDNEVKYLVFNYTDNFEVEGFDRGLVIYRNKTDQRKKKVLVVESGLDVPWADQNGLTEQVDVFAILSAKMTRIQADMLAKYEEVILALDKDYAGEKGTELAIKYLQNRTKLSLAHYPSGCKDLGDCNGEQMIELLENRTSPLAKTVRKLELRIE